MLRRLFCVTASLAAAFALGGCALFAARPEIPERRTHVIIVGLDGLKAADIDPALTPHLYLMQRDGAYTWAMQARHSGDRAAVYAEALAAGRPTPLLQRLRSLGLTTLAVTRTNMLAGSLTGASSIVQAGDSPGAAGAAAAFAFVDKLPACMFVELSAGEDAIEDCDAGLGAILGTIRRAGLAGQTTVIVMSATGPDRAWMIRGPDTRHGHELAAPVAAASTAGSVLHLLAPALLSADTPAAPFQAFRAYSREPNSETERTVPRGSLQGRVLRPDGGPMPKCSVLLVRDEPPDGISERRADANQLGEFRFDSVPAGRYDHVFVFDNLPSPLRRSLLVAQDLVVQRDVTARLELRYERVGGQPKLPDIPRADRFASFLTDEQLTTLARHCRRGTELPLLAADAFSGQRTRTTAVREWLLASAKELRDALQRAPVDRAVVAKAADLAVAYDVNRASGLLSDPEERDLRAALAMTAVHALRAAERRELPDDLDTATALTLAAGALGPGKLSRTWVRKADEMFEKRFEPIARQTEADPDSLDTADLCRMLEYAMINDAIGCGNYLDDELGRTVEVAAACLTPAQRRVSPAGRTATPAMGLGFLGLAKTAFADEDVGGRMAWLWRACGSPVWAPRGEESLLGTLLTAASEPPSRPFGPVRSERLTDTATLLTRDWGALDEWFVYVNGWRVELHVRGARLATLETAPPNSTAASRPQVLRFTSSPGYDYVLLGGWMSPLGRGRLPAYRHVLFNKLTGYVVIADEFTGGILSTTVRDMNGFRDSVVTGSEGVDAQLLALDADLTLSEGAPIFTSSSSTPVFVVIPPPAGAAAGAAELEPWDVTATDLADDAAAAAVHVSLRTDRGMEYVRLARTPAHVACNVEDSMLEGTVGVIRRGPKSSDLLLIDARWAQSEGAFFRLDRGEGYATIHEAGRADGWSGGRSREVTVSLGDNAPLAPSLMVDGRGASLEKNGDRFSFGLSSGAHTFRVK